MKQQILSIIPARGGSKGLPGKNIKILCGKPLIAWTIEESLKSKYITRTVVSTEDDKIAGISESYGAEVVRRPVELAHDNSSTNDVVKNLLEKLSNEFNYQPDYIVLLQCTSPLRKVFHIDEAFKAFFRSNGTAESLISVCKEDHPPYWLKAVSEKNMLVDFLPYNKEKYQKRQDFPDLYRINGVIYISSTDSFLKNNGFQSQRTMPYIMEKSVSVDVDDEMDFLFAEFLMNRLNNA